MKVDKRKGKKKVRKMKGTREENMCQTIQGKDEIQMDKMSSAPLVTSMDI
jgi:hypothetical protein